MYLILHCSPPPAPCSVPGMPEPVWVQLCGSWKQAKTADSKIRWPPTDIQPRYASAAKVNIIPSLMALTV